MQVGLCYASHGAVLAVSRRGYVPGGTFPRLKDYDEQRTIIQNISVAEETILRDFECEELRSNTAIENSYEVQEGKVEEISVLWTPKVLILVSLKGQADRSEWAYAFLQYMESTSPLDVTEKTWMFTFLMKAYR